MVNCQLLCVVHGIRTPPFVIPNAVRNPAVEEEKRFFADALNDRVGEKVVNVGANLSVRPS